MKQTVKNIILNKEKTIPILSFPSAQLLGITVKELLESPEMQVRGMKAIADRCTIGASLNMMDLSVEAEAFGAEIVYYDQDVPTVRKGIIDNIFDAVNDNDFVICYHNCGDAVKDMAKDISTLGADIYHFGNAISLKDIIPLMPKDALVMGNIDPVLFTTSTPEKIKESVKALYEECKAYPNFMISSGCDIPAMARWENIDVYFEKVKEIYSE